MSSDDWARPPKLTVDILAIAERNPKHAHCKMCLHHSPKNPTYVGLYCVEHDHWFTWVNDDQMKYLRKIGAV